MNSFGRFATLAASAEGAFSVADVTRRARYLIEAGFDRVWVRGEITGFKAYQSGHWYFTLRDRQAQVRCVMWRSDNLGLTAPQEGTEVFVEARPTVWEERGEFRLVVRQLVPTDASGLWQLRLEQARAALERDGLLDPARKRRLPAYPMRLAIVTSVDGAALRDMVSIIGRRWPAVEVLVVPARVQGEEAEGDLLRALNLVNRIPDLDLVIVGRGGGSREDLWAFNSEKVARAVAAVRVPTISAVGHETDVSLTDLVADHRAPTPSAAAEAAVPDRREVLRAVGVLAGRLGHGLRRRIELGRERLERTADRLGDAMDDQIKRRKHRLATLAAALDALSPLKVLERGYAVARDESGAVLSRMAQFPAGQKFRLTLRDGEVGAESLGAVK
ncbi:MAG: exodeoxyribonuclease 7 large subunit [Gemmatimonadales bacterium]|nr:Exodeoxyribonuclease 7 large subunit [bacterium HR33]GIW50744.1 MAG: exodeoxyribonuclease 7 large subunit [Gemmatimonadales bacterium]